MRHCLLSVALLTPALMLWPALSNAQELWVIEKFNTEIAIQENGVIAVTETITADFKNTPKHGIIRDLPYVYSDAAEGRIYTQVSDIVVEQDGTAAQTEITRSSANISIRIGDPNITITGKHEYRISYLVEGVLQSFGGVDELQWNSTGNAWDAPIAFAQASVSVPADILQVACYEGGVGSVLPCDATATQGNMVTFSSQGLGVGEGLTVAVGFKPGVIPIITVSPPPSLSDALISLEAGIAALAASLLGIFVVMRHWHKFGRDRYWQRAHLPGVASNREGTQLPEKILPLWHNMPVSAEYDPPDGLRPAELGVLMDEKADTLDISATIIDLASRGYLEISEVPKKWKFGKSDYTFTRTGKVEEGLLPYESTLLGRLFDDGVTVQMSSLKNTFYKDLQTIKEQLYKEVVAKKLFDANPHKVRGMYLAAGVGIVLLSAVIFWGLAAVIGQADDLLIYHKILAGFVVGLSVTGAVVIGISPFMSRKTGYGREVYQRSLGYELFVSGTEKYRAKFLENEGLFFAVLPYAVMFGVTDKLARAFREMEAAPPAPSWYHGQGTFHAAAFASDLGNFSSSLGTAMASAPSSSGSGGGGFSGGGFGGGGGSSW